jgi:transcriptional regulator with XRE-family HTH domain
MLHDCLTKPYNGPATTEGPAVPRTATPFARRLYQARIGRRLSQLTLAEAAGVTLAAINNYERGFRVPALVVAARLARVLGLSDQVRAFATLDVAPHVIRQRGDLRPRKMHHAFYLDLAFRPGRPVVKADVDAASKVFADVADEFITAGKWSRARLAHAAGVSLAVLSRMFGEGSHGLNLRHYANVALVLNMRSELQAFAVDDELVPLAFPDDDDGQS